MTTSQAPATAAMTPNYSVASDHMPRQSGQVQPTSNLSSVTPNQSAGTVSSQSNTQVSLPIGSIKAPEIPTEQTAHSHLTNTSVPMNDLNVEVNLPDNPHSWYKAILEDFDNDSVVVSFMDINMRPSSTKVPFESVKIVPTPTDSPVELMEGEKCQVYSTKEGENVQGWHDAVIKLVRGCFYMFDYVSAGDRKNDVLSAEVFRKPDNSPRLEKNHLYKYSYPVPEPVPEDMADMANHQILKVRLPSSKIYFDVPKSELVMITNLDKNVKLFHLFADFHLKFIRQKAAFRKSIEVATKRIAVLKAPKESNVAATHIEEFTIKEGLMGLAIGASGVNITQARQITGVKYIQTENDNTIKIYADTVEAAKRARAILEFAEEVIDIPKDKIPRIIGRQGSLIQEMVDRSGVVKVTVEKDSSDRRISESETTKRLIVRGTVESIQNMRVLIDYYLEHVESMDEIIAETHQLQQELKSISGNQNGAGFGGNHAQGDHDMMMLQNPMHQHQRPNNGNRGGHMQGGGHRGGPTSGMRRGGRRGQR